MASAPTRSLPAAAFNATAGTTYRIAVGGSAGASSAGVVLRHFRGAVSCVDARAAVKAARIAMFKAKKKAATAQRKANRATKLAKAQPSAKHKAVAKLLGRRRRS